MQRSKAIVVGTLVGAAVAVSTASAAFAANGRGFGMGFGRRRGGGALFMLLLLAAAVVLAVMLWRGRHPHPAQAQFVAAPPLTSPTLNAQAILADRLARGEISPDDYRAAVSVLRETAPPTA
jgi:putative membrane protein